MNRLSIQFLNFIVLIISVSLFSTAFAAPQNKKNIVLVVADDASPTLGCYGDPIAKTPHIDALAADGCRFDNAFATVASCSPSRSVILTGVYSHFNGQYGLQHHVHKSSTYHNAISLSLPFVLQQHGYRTARIGKFHVGPEKVFPFEAKLHANSRNPVLMAKACREFIAADDQRPFFLYFNPVDPHRSGFVDRRSESEWKPNLFGNKPNRGQHFEVQEVFYRPGEVPIPAFLPATEETREELAQYYQSISRVDQGVGRLIEILRAEEVYEQTLIVVTSDHGMAFSGAKTTLYEPGLKVPLIVRDPDSDRRGISTEALVSHVDIAPTLVEFADALDNDRNGPRDWVNPDKYWLRRGEDFEDNRAGGNLFRSYQGKSWLPLLSNPDQNHHEEVFGSHIFHEVHMYYPMRMIRNERFKLIWNLAHDLEFPIAQDLWEASSWQSQYEKGPNAAYGKKKVVRYLNRPEFELYDLASDPDESKNLALSVDDLNMLDQLKERLRQFQDETNDPWLQKWDRE